MVTRLAKINNRFLSILLSSLVERDYAQRETPSPRHIKNTEGKTQLHTIKHLQSERCQHKDVIIHLMFQQSMHALKSYSEQIVIEKQEKKRF